MYCKHCGTGNEPDAVFCEKCGNKLDILVPVNAEHGRRCSYCGSVIREEAKFCKNCGNTFHEATPAAQPYSAMTVPQPAYQVSVDNSYPVYHQNQPYVPGVQMAPRTLGLTQPLLLGLIGTFIGVIGAFLPWASFLAISVNGIDADGIFTFFLSLVAVGVIFSGRNKTRASGAGIGLIIIGVLMMLISIYYILNIKYTASQSEWGALVQVGSGLYITAFAGVILLIAGGWAVKQ